MNLLTAFQISYHKFLVNHHTKIKWISVILLLLSGIMFLAGGLKTLALPEFAKYSKWDIWIWSIILYSLALSQIITMIRCDCPNQYKWSNSILIISGFVLIIVGCLFGLKYPPHRWQMTVFPLIGFTLSVLGKRLNKIARSKGTHYGKIN